MRSRLSRLIVVAGAVAALLAVRPAAPVQAQAGVGERTLFVSAVDGKGEPISDLRADDVVVREDGVRREVLRVSRATEPIDIALLVDNSAAADDAISHEREALRRFIAAMAAGNQLAIVGLADRPTILVDYTSDRQRLDAAVGRLFAMTGSGMTLLDAIIETSRGLGRRDTPRAAIVAIVNDGIEFSNRYHRDVGNAVEAAAVPLHVMAIGTFAADSDGAVRERALVLDVVTSESGGQRVTLLSPMALGTAMERLARQLSSQFKVVYGRPQSLIPPEKLELTSARPGVTVRGTPMRGQPGA